MPAKVWVSKLPVTICRHQVASIVGRAEVMAAFFSIISYRTYLASLRAEIGCIRSFFLTCASWALCLTSGLCKETGMTVLGVCAVHDWAATLHACTYGGRSLAATLGPTAIRTVGHAATAAIFILHRFPTISPEADTGRASREINGRRDRALSLHFLSFPVLFCILTELP